MATNEGVALLERFIDAIHQQQHAKCSVTVSENSVDASLECQKDLLSAIEQVRVVEGHKDALPVTEAMLLLDVAQRGWNATANLKFSDKDGGDADAFRTTKTLYRVLVTHYFLLGINFFAPTEVRRTYLANHPTHGEKAVLMCLKTARTAAATEVPEVRQGAEELLQSALTIATIPVDHSACHTMRTSDMRVEVLFTSVSVYWDLQMYQEAMDVAEALHQEVRGYKPYQESLLQLIFSTANAAAQHCPAAPGTNALTRSGNQEETAPTSTAPSAAPQGVAPKEIHLQTLLRLSLQIQGTEIQDRQKRRALTGTTRLQLAESLERTGQLEEAATAALQAYDDLQSLEPLVSLTRIYAKRSSTLCSALDVFRTIASTSLPDSALGENGKGPSRDQTPLSLEEVLSLATVIVDSAVSAEENAHVCDELVHFIAQRVCPSDSPEAKPRSQDMCCLVAFLARTETEVAGLELCRVLEWVLDICHGESSNCKASRQSLMSPIPPTHPGTNLKEHFRFFFCACWATGARELADTNCGDSMPSMETVECQYKCLTVALRFAPEVASPEEEESLLVKMTELAFLSQKGTPTHTDRLASCFTLLRAKHRHSLFAKLALCQLAFVLPNATADTAVAYVTDLLSLPISVREDSGVNPTAVLAAFGTLVNFLLAQGLCREAGTVANIITGVRGDEGVPSILDGAAHDEQRLAFLRVSADAALLQLSEEAHADNHSTEAYLTLVGRICTGALEVLERHPVSPDAKELDGRQPAKGQSMEGNGSLCGPGQWLSADDVSWWCRLLWYFADSFIVMHDPVVALRLHSGAVDLFSSVCCRYDDNACRDLLLDRVVRAMALEFDFFTSGAPALSVEKLHQYTALAKDCASDLAAVSAFSEAERDSAARDEAGSQPEAPQTRPSATAAVLVAAQAEAWLRELEHRSTQADPAGGENEEGETGRESNVDVAGAMSMQSSATCPPAEMSTQETRWLSAEALLRAGTASEELEALAAATGTLAAALRHRKDLVTLSVELQLTAVQALMSPANEAANEGASLTWSMAQQAAVMLFQAHKLSAGILALQKRVTESVVLFAKESVLLPTISVDAEDAASSTNTEDKRAVATSTSEKLETLLEFFAVEAWNTAVDHTALRDRAEALTWRRLALALAHTLPDTNGTKQAITDFAEHMPVL